MEWKFRVLREGERSDADREGKREGERRERERQTERTSRQNPFEPKPKPKVSPVSCTDKGKRQLLGSTHRKSFGCQRDRLPKY